MSFKRAIRVADLIMADISDILLREIGDPRIKSVTITGVAIGDHENVVLCLRGEPHQSRNFVINGSAARAEKEPDFTLRKFPNQFLQQRKCRIVGIYAEKEFIVRIILPAKTGVVLVCLNVEPFDRLETTDGRGKIAAWEHVFPGLQKKTQRAPHGEQIIDERNRCNRQDSIVQKCPGHRVSKSTNSEFLYTR